jgi:hypothetical protein
MHCFSEPIFGEVCEKMNYKTVLLLVVAATMSMGLASAYEYPSTNELNRDGENPLQSGVGPHVNLVEAGVGYVTLEFVNPRDYWACFEYRTDMDESQAISEDHFNPWLDDALYPYYCLNAGVTGETRTETFYAQEVVEVRLAFGAERDWDFDWTPFLVVQPNVPVVKEDCFRGGWRDFDIDFRNQGMCVSYVQANENAGKR